MHTTLAHDTVARARLGGFPILVSRDNNTEDDEIYGFGNSFVPLELELISLS